MLERAFINRLPPTAYVLPGLEERRIESNGAPETVEALASLAWKGLLKRASDRQRSIVRQLVRARIAQKSLDQLEQCRSLGWGVGRVREFVPDTGPDRHGRLSSCRFGS